MHGTRLLSYSSLIVVVGIALLHTIEAYRTFDFTADDNYQPIALPTLEDDQPLTQQNISDQPSPKLAPIDYKTCTKNKICEERCGKKCCTFFQPIQLFNNPGKIFTRPSDGCKFYCADKYYRKWYESNPGGYCCKPAIINTFTCKYD